MKDVLAILKEVHALGPVRVQKIWGLRQALVFEIYTAQYRRIYLICDYSHEHPTFHLQLEKPRGSKTTTPILLASRKYLEGKTLKFGILKYPSQGLSAQITTHERELILIFDLKSRPQIGLLSGEALLAQSGQNFALSYETQNIKTETHDLSANLAQAEIYNKEREKYINKQAFLSQQQVFSSTLKKLTTLKNNLNKDLNKFLHMLEREHEAELLRFNLHTIKKGQRELLLMDYSCDPPQQKKILLDPSLSPKQSLEKIFSKIKKARRGISNIKPRLAAVEAEISELLLTGPEALSEVIITDSIKPKAKAHKRLPYRIFLSSDKIPIWVGKSARDNDDLTLHHARGKEWWFHVQQGAGSHVVVKCSNDVLLPDTMLEAAMLAAHFSAQKLETNLEIIYTRIKNIKKPKGFAPGRVLVEQEKSLMLRMDTERLKKLCTNME